MNKSNALGLSYNNLSKLTESDLIALCQLNGFEPDELNFLMLGNNKLTDLNFITENTVFINLKGLYLSNNLMTNINNIKYLSNLKELKIDGLNLIMKKKL